jgi:phosphoglycerate transport regulatory protein PgtC
LGGVEFNDELSSSRRDVVNSLYDHIITYRHKELRDGWKAVYAADEWLAKSKSSGVAQAKTFAGEARRLLTQVPINDKRAADKETTAAFKSKSGLKAQLETEWENFARNNYSKAKELADKALAGAR